MSEVANQCDVFAFTHVVKQRVNPSLNVFAQGFDAPGRKRLTDEPAQFAVFRAVEHQQVAFNHRRKLGVFLN